MKKSLKITLVGALALFMLAGCGAAPAASAESSSAASAGALGASMDVPCSRATSSMRSWSSSMSKGLTM